MLLRSRTSRKVEEEMEAIEKDYVVYKQNKMGECARSHANHMQVTCSVMLMSSPDIAMFSNVGSRNTTWETFHDHEPC